LRRHEAVVELQNRGRTAKRIAGDRIDRYAHQIITGTVDQIAVGVELEIAGARIVHDAAEHRLIVGEAGQLRHHEEAVAVDRHVGGDAFAGDRALHRIGGDRMGDHAVGVLPGCAA